MLSSDWSGRQPPPHHQPAADTRPRHAAAEGGGQRRGGGDGGQVSRDWWRAGHVTSVLTSDWQRGHSAGGGAGAGRLLLPGGGHRAAHRGRQPAVRRQGEP